MKYKYYKTAEVYQVARRDNYGCGWAYNPLPHKFRTEDEAKKFIDIQKRGDADAKKNK